MKVDEFRCVLDITKRGDVSLKITINVTENPTFNNVNFLYCSVFVAVVIQILSR